MKNICTSPPRRKLRNILELNWSEWQIYTLSEKNSVDIIWLAAENFVRRNCNSRNILSLEIQNMSNWYKTKNKTNFSCKTYVRISMKKFRRTNCRNFELVQKILSAVKIISAEILSDKVYSGLLQNLIQSSHGNKFSCWAQ